MSIVIIEALLRGVADGQDILTMSLGGADGWTESSSSVVSSRISANGKIVTIAAGNDVRTLPILEAATTHDISRATPVRGTHQVQETASTPFQLLVLTSAYIKTSTLMVSNA